MSKSLVGRYRRTYPRLWIHPHFQKLTLAQRLIALYILTSHQSNRIGLFRFSPATAAEDLLLGVDTCKTGVRHVCLTFGWVFDDDARVMYIPTWWRWNCPENKDVLRGNLKDLSEIPPCALIEVFAQNLTHVPPDYHDTFIDTCKARVPRHASISSSNSNSNKPGAVTGASALRASAPKKAGVEGKTTNDDHGSTGDATPQLVRLAKETLELTNPNQPIEGLVDAFLDQHRGHSRQQAVAALNVALASGRQSA